MNQCHVNHLLDIQAEAGAKQQGHQSKAKAVIGNALRLRNSYPNPASAPQPLQGSCRVEDRKKLGDEIRHPDLSLRRLSSFASDRAWSTEPTPADRSIIAAWRVRQDRKSTRL